MSDISPKMQVQIDDLNPKEIFAEISSEIGVDKKSYTPRQKTRLNYTYVVLLNLILIFAVSLGVFTVYRIFREQGIKMTEGTGGIQSLEILLLEQESRRQAQELQAKEALLQQAQQILSEIEGQLALIRSDIQGQVSTELDRQRSALEEQIQRELEGKSASEQLEIRNQYQQQLQQLQQQSQQEINRRIAEAENEIHQELEQRQAEQLRLQNDLKVLTERLRVQEQNEVVQVQPSPIIQNVYDDSGVSFLFNSIELMLRSQNYSDIEAQLEKIEDIYSRPAPEVKKAADLFLVSLIRDYISLSNNSSNLLTPIVINTNITIAAEQNNDDMARFRLIIEEISRLVNDNPRNPAITARLRTLEEQTPDAFVFYNAYRSYLAQEDARKAAPLIKQAEQAYKQRRYPQSISIYQNILRTYPNIPTQQNLLNDLYLALQAQSTSEQSNVYIPRDTREIPEAKSIKEIQDANLIYMKAPDGYVYDMGGERIVVSLLPGIIMKPKDTIQIFRVGTTNGVQLSLIGEGTVIEGKGKYISAKVTTSLIKLGDIVYISK
ncbi:MAG: hypothetical protein ACRC9L_07235 [Brevinema sp.]